MSHTEKGKNLTDLTKIGAYILIPLGISFLVKPEAVYKLLSPRLQNLFKQLVENSNESHLVRAELSAIPDTVDNTHAVAETLNAFQTNIIHGKGRILSTNRRLRPHQRMYKAIQMARTLIEAQSRNDLA